MRRAFAFMAVSAVCCLMLVEPAHATVPSPYALFDPVGTENVYRKNDIRWVRIVHGSTVTITVKTREGVNPATHPAWSTPPYGETYVWIELITNPGETVDFAVYMQSTPQGASQPRLYEIGTGVICNPTFEFVRGDRFRFTFPRSCIDNPPWIGVGVTYSYDPPVGARRVDWAPNVGRSRRVAFDT